MDGDFTKLTDYQRGRQEGRRAQKEEDAQEIASLEADLEASQAMRLLAEEEVDRLREGIKKHREFTRNNMAAKMYYDVDTELYALLKEGKEGE